MNLYTYCVTAARGTPDRRCHWNLLPIHTKRKLPTCEWVSFPWPQKNKWTETQTQMRTSCGSCCYNTVRLAGMKFFFHYILHFKSSSVLHGAAIFASLKTLVLFQYYYYYYYYYYYLDIIGLRVLTRNLRDFSLFQGLAHIIKIVPPAGV
jgi:hypothetical protein